MEISLVNEDHLTEIERLAYVIWKEHYTPIIGQAQVLYMLDKFQSVTSMRQQLKEGYSYFQVTNDKKLIGYAAVQFRSDDTTKECFISKIYLEKSQRGNGFGKQIFEYITDFATLHKAQILKLTVNKYNSETIKMYHKIGFKTAREVIFDIGNGYIMDDFELVKEI